MKKNSIIYSLLGVILCGLATPAAADFCGQNYNNCCEWSMLDGKMTLGVDWLYWKVEQDGIIPGAIVISDDSVIPTTTVAKTLRPNFKYDSGFRVNLGYELPCDSWDMNVCYTYIPSHANLSSFASASPFETFNTIGGGSFTTFASKWNLTSNNIDFDIGRTVCFGENLKVRPHVGLRANWFDQKFRSFGTNTVDDVVTANAFVAKEKFQGYGVEGGLWADYQLGCGMSIVGHVGGSILYSKYTAKAATIIGLSDVDGEITAEALIGASDTIRIGTPMVDYFIGLQYADCFCDMIVKAHVGWEQHVMFDTNRYLTSGNLSAQGLTLGLDVGF